MNACRWTLATLVVFGVLRRCESFSFTRKPADPTVVVEGVNNTQVELVWDFTATSGYIVGIFRKRPDGTNKTHIAARSDSSGEFTILQDALKAEYDTVLPATLVIKNVDRADEYIYSFSVTDNLGVSKLFDEITVDVVAPVNLTNVTSSYQSVLEGSNFQLFCEASGDPDPNIIWTRVQDDDGSNIKEVHQEPTWDFPNINRTASGAYRCTADNGIGNPASHEVKVNVKYPAKILALASEYEVAAQESLSLICQAEGSPQPTYTWTPCDPQQSVCNSSKLNVPGARNNSVYTFTCRVANDLDNDTRNTSVFVASDVINVTLVITSESCTDGEYDQAIWEKLSKKIDEIFANEIGYKSVQLKDISCGSVIVDVALKFSSTVKEIKVLSILEEAVKNGMFGEFNVSAIRGTRHDPETTTVATSPTSPSDSKKTLIIVGAVLGSLVVVAVVVAVIVCVRKKRKCKRKDTKEVHSSESPEQGTVANPPSVTYDTVEETSKGQREVVKGNPTVSYAVVDKSKQRKKDKKPKPGELQYAELAEFNPRSQGMPRSSASYGQGHPTETQYADVNAM